MATRARRRRRPAEPEPEVDGGNRLVRVGTFAWVKRTTRRSLFDRQQRVQLGGYWALVLAPVRRRKGWWIVRELSSWGTYAVNGAWCRVPREPSKAVLQYQQLLKRLRFKGLRGFSKGD